MASLALNFYDEHGDIVTFVVKKGLKMSNAAEHRMSVYAGLVGIKSRRYKGSLGASRSKLAQATGLSPETLDHTLRTLQRWGLVEKEKFNTWGAKPIHGTICWEHGRMDGPCSKCLRRQQ
jgi:hypothetical protein